MASSSPLSSSQRSPRTFPAMDLDLLLPALLTGAITTHAAAPALGVTVRTVQRHLEAAGGGRPSSARAPAKITRTTLRNCPRCSRRRLRREPWNMASALSVLFTGGEAVPKAEWLSIVALQQCRLAAVAARRRTTTYSGQTLIEKSTSLGEAPSSFAPRVPLLAQEEYSCEGSL